MYGSGYVPNADVCNVHICMYASVYIFLDVACFHANVYCHHIVKAYHTAHTIDVILSILITFTIVFHQVSGSNWRASCYESTILVLLKLYCYLILKMCNLLYLIQYRFLYYSQSDVHVGYILCNVNCFLISFWCHVHTQKVSGWSLYISDIYITYQLTFRRCRLEF